MERFWSTIPSKTLEPGQHFNQRRGDSIVGIEGPGLAEWAAMFGVPILGICLFIVQLIWEDVGNC